MLVAFGCTLGGPGAAMVAAAAALWAQRESGAGGVDKSAVRTAVALAAGACETSVDRVLIKQLHRWLLGSCSAEDEA